MYSTRSTVLSSEEVQESSSNSIASATTGVRSIGALLVSDERVQETSSGFQVFPSHHTVTASRITTSTDSRGHIPVLEYPLRGQTIMIDTETRMCHWTGIWKALGKSKADVVRLIESQPEIAGRIRKIRGGYLKVQGTWMPYEIAQELCRRVAWDIRHDLVPLFGPTFPDSCIAPGQPGFGKPVLTSPQNSSRRSNRDPKALEAARQAARTAQNNKWVNTAQQAAGPIPVEARRPQHEMVVAQEQEQQAEDVEQTTEEGVENIKPLPTASEDLVESEGREKKELSALALEEEEPRKGASRSTRRVRTTSGNWYAGGAAAPTRGLQASYGAVPSPTRYSPYRFPTAPPPFPSSKSPFLFAPPPSHYPPVAPAYPQGLYQPIPYHTPHLHPSHAHFLSQQHAPHAHALARAPSVPNLQFPPVPSSTASSFTPAPHFSGGAPIRRTVSDPQAQSWPIQSASADAEGGRLALGVGAGSFAESSLSSMPSGVPVSSHRAQNEESRRGPRSQELGSFAAGSAASLRLPPIARVEQRSTSPASFTPSTAPILPPISHLRGYEAHSLSNGRPHPPRPTLITQEDLLSHAARTTRSHPNYPSDPHRHLTAPSSPIAPSPTSPLSAASSQGSLLFQPSSQGQTPSPLTPVTQQFHQNEQQLGHLILLERWAGEPSAEVAKGAF